MTVDSFPQYLKTLQIEIDFWLTAYVDRLEQQQVVQKRLIESIRYCLLAPGKRIRPALVLMTCEAMGGTRITALPAAAAVEMIHNYSLIHDDLPAMDDDDLRRGRPTCHKQFDEATAILTGDALLTLAFQVLAEEVASSELSRNCIKELSQAAGLTGMIGGQMDDILQEGKAGSLQQLQSIHERKTGALLRVSVRLGALTAWQGKYDSEKLAHLNRFAESLGLAFQITDDLLDVQSQPEQLGKATQKDADKGKLTYPGLLGIERTRQELQAAYERGMMAVDQLGERAAVLREVLRFVVERDR
ncbi:MAG: polyprenyl synthetase family protein [Planctomycetia bacterium]|nr:polyprenyl synthetase family protein [Planctomycetia bacterium]